MATDYFSYPAYRYYRPGYIPNTIPPYQPLVPYQPYGDAYTMTTTVTYYTPEDKKEEMAEEEFTLYEYVVAVLQDGGAPKVVDWGAIFAKDVDEVKISVARKIVHDEVPSDKIKIFVRKFA